jgi:hypothetical protein
MKTSIIGLLFAAAFLVIIPISPQVTPRGIELKVDGAAGHHRPQCGIIGGGAHTCVILAAWALDLPKEAEASQGQ